MTARAIPIAEASALGRCNESGAFEARGPYVVLEFVDGREGGHPQTVRFQLKRDEAENLAQEIMRVT